MKRLTVVILLAVFIIGLSACGVPKEEYSQALSDIEMLEQQRQELNKQIGDLQNDYNNQKSVYVDLISEYGDLEKRYEDLEKEYIDSQHQCADLETRINQSTAVESELRTQIEQQRIALDIGPNHEISSEEIISNPDKYYSMFYEDREDWMSQQLAQNLEYFKNSYDKNFYVEHQTDKYDKVMQLWCFLWLKNIKSIIKLGNLDDENASFEESNDVWLMVLYPSGGGMAVEAKDVSMKGYSWADTQKPIEANQKYYGTRGFRYATPSDLKADISYRWQIKEAEKE